MENVVEKVMYKYYYFHSNLVSGYSENKINDRIYPSYSTEQNNGIFIFFKDHNLPINNSIEGTMVEYTFEDNKVYVTGYKLPEYKYTYDKNKLVYLKDVIIDMFLCNEDFEDINRYQIIATLYRIYKENIDIYGKKNDLTFVDKIHTERILFKKNTDVSYKLRNKITMSGVINKLLEENKIRRDN